MSKELLLIFLADAILIVHVLFVFFVVFGLFAIYLGCFLKWHWIRNRIFRIVHLSAIGIVVIQSWIGFICPLTIWEMALRVEAGSETYSGFVYSALVAKVALLYSSRMGIYSNAYNLWWYGSSKLVFSAPERTHEVVFIYHLTKRSSIGPSGLDAAELRRCAKRYESRGSCN